MAVGAVLAAIKAASSIAGVIGKSKGLAGKAAGEESGGGFGGALMSGIKGVMGGIGGGKATGLTAALGLGKSIAGKIQQKKADSMLPAAENPEERALASYAARRKRAFQTGTATASQRNALRDSMKTGVENSIKVGGGAKGLNMMTRMFNQAQLGLADTEMTGEKAFADMETQQKNRIAQRKLELGLLKYNTAQARAAQQVKEGKQMTSLSLAKAVGVGNINPYGDSSQTSDTTGSAGGKSTLGVGNEKG